MSDRSVRHSPLALALLALLVESPMHAYRMQQLIKIRAKDSVVNVARSNSVYQSIERLRRAELIRVREVLREEGRPERTVYEATVAGRETLQQWLSLMLSTPAREFPEFPAALAFAGLTTPRQVQEHLEARRTALASQVSKAEADNAVALPRVLLLEEEYRLAMARAELRWVDAILDDLGSGSLSWTKDSLAPLMEGQG